jgi:hypothetical protein
MAKWMEEVMTKDKEVRDKKAVQCVAECHLHLSTCRVMATVWPSQSAQVRSALGYCACGNRARLSGCAPYRNTQYFHIYSFRLWIMNASIRCRDSSVGIATGYGLDDGGVWVRVPVRPRIIFFSTSSTKALGPTQPLFQWVPGDFSQG